jgi:hypothetical protein
MTILVLSMEKKQDGNPIQTSQSLRLLKQDMTSRTMTSHPRWARWEVAKDMTTPP